MEQESDLFLDAFFEFDFLLVVLDFHWAHVFLLNTFGFLFRHLLEAIMEMESLFAPQISKNNS